MNSSEQRHKFKDLTELATILNHLKSRVSLNKEIILDSRRKRSFIDITELLEEIKDFQKKEKDILRRIELLGGVVKEEKIHHRYFIIEGSGLFSKNPEVGHNSVFHPLRSVKHFISVNSCFVSVRTEQTFVSPFSTKPVELIYRFPLMFSSPPHRVTVIITNPETQVREVFEAKCKEKIEAEEEYDDSLAEGKSAVLMMRDERNHVTMNLGNIRPGFEIQVISHVLQELQSEIKRLSEDSHLLRMKFSIPPIFNSKEDSKKKRNELQLPTRILHVEGMIQTDHLDGEFDSFDFGERDEEFAVSKNEEKNELHFTSKRSFSLFEELEFTIYLRKPKLLYAILEEEEESKESPGIINHSGIISINPIVKESFFGVRETCPVPIEHIVILDRSGSMKGKRIRFAQQALNLFIRSLDVDNHPYVNIIGFGTKMEVEFPDGSKPLNEETFPSMLSYISNSQANLGGTNMSLPLQYVLEKLPEIDGYRRVVYLLTDGEDILPGNVMNLMRKHSHKFRIFSFGIGNVVDPTFLHNLSKLTNGKAVMIDQDKYIRPKVIEQLKCACEDRVFWDVQITFLNLPENSEVVWAQAVPQFLVPFQRKDLYFFLKNYTPPCESTGNKKISRMDVDKTSSEQPSVKLSFRINRTAKRPVEIIIPFTKISKQIVESTGRERSVISVFAGMKQIEYLEHQIKKTPILEKELNTRILELSLKYNLLTSQTNFVCSRFIYENYKNKNSKPILDRYEDDDERGISNSLETVDVVNPDIPTFPYVPGRMMNDNNKKYVVQLISEDVRRYNMMKEKIVTARKKLQQKKEMLMKNMTTRKISTITPPPPSYSSGGGGGGGGGNRPMMAAPRRSTTNMRRLHNRRLMDMKRGFKNFRGRSSCCSFANVNAVASVRSSVEQKRAEKRLEEDLKRMEEFEKQLEEKERKRVQQVMERHQREKEKEEIMRSHHHHKEEEEEEEEEGEVSSHDRFFMLIVDHQRLKGNWDKSIINELGFDLSIIESEFRKNESLFNNTNILSTHEGNCDTEDNDMSFSFFITSIIIMILEEYFEEKEDEWGLLVKKSRRLLEKNGLLTLLEKSKVVIKKLNLV